MAYRPRDSRRSQAPARSHASILTPSRQFSQGYVIANSAQPELDYENSSGNQTYSSYNGIGGVQVGGLVRRTALALSLGDYNILISSQVTSQSRVIYYRNVVQRLEKVAPFLSYDSDPYPVVLNGAYLLGRRRLYDH